MSTTQSPHSITVIGIPTSDRPTELDRALTHLITHATTYHRTPHIIIADDSSPKNLDKNRQTITRHQSSYSGRITHLDYAAREKLAEDIIHSENSESSNTAHNTISPDSVRYAILGHGTATDRALRTGALRNSILLYAAGSKILFIDDDVIVSPKISPLTSQTDLDIEHVDHFASSDVTQQAWYFPDYGTMPEYFPEVHTDYIAAHEKLLGTDIIGTTGTSEDKAAGTGNRHILTTSSGAYGHSWLRVMSPINLNAPDKNYDLFGTSEREYETRKATPFIARNFPTYSTSTGSRCISLNLGVDATRLIPPFAPMHRGQDSIFGHLLTICFPQAVKGNIPFLIEHKRPTTHRALTNSLFALTTVSRMTTSGLLAARHGLNSRSDISLLDLGQALESLAAREDFRTFIMTECVRDLMFHRDFLINLTTAPDTPEYWKDDLTTTITEINDILANNIGLPLFWDIASWSEAQDGGWQAFSEYIKNIAALIKEWPHVFEICLLRNQKDT